VSLDPAHIAWSREHFRIMAIGGIWGVPRSGLVFTKTDDKSLKLTERMPYFDEMPMSEEEFVAYQDGDFQAIAEHFRAAGIEVTR
jgi:hypothetical protein